MEIILYCGQMIFVIFASLICGSRASFRDGDLYKFTSVADGTVFTVSGKAGLSQNVTAEPWQDGGNQKWLAVEAVTVSDRFFLIPKWQSWNWNDFTKDTTKDRRDHIPDFTVALGTSADPSAVISVQGFTGKSIQQWKTAEGTNGALLIKNLEDDRCIYNPGEQKAKPKSTVKKVASKVTHLFGSHHEKKRIAGTLELIACDATNPQQLWKVELASIN